MQLLYEEDGEFRVGTVLAQSAAGFQVESPHGRRSKVKAAQVLLEFERPPAGELLPAAGKFAAELDTDFLWRCSGAAEFAFRDLAREYVGRDPTPVEAAGILVKLHAAPMYFYRRGRGRYEPAPEETLKLALAGAERKRRLQEQVSEWAARLARFDCPAEIERLRDELLYAPDRAKPETKALEEGCRKSGLTPAKLFERCGKLPDSHAYHLNRFLHEFYPAGTGFARHEGPATAQDLPPAETSGFSLDDEGTTEIDDAFSVRRLAGGEWRIGVHIAAPALGFAPGSALDGIARARLSTAYMPGQKITMLPPEIVERFSLRQDGERPVASIYFNVDEGDWSVRGRHSRLERMRIAANLRLGESDALNKAFDDGARAGLRYEDELRTLWHLAGALEARRGKPSVNAAIPDFVFRVEDGRVRITPRRRGSPLDKLVSELMILANGSWGELLAEREVAAIYRVQTSGKVRMSAHPEAHESLGLGCYAWFTSPLRRYVDLLNQWQLAAALEGKKAPFARNSEQLLAGMRAFEIAHLRYQEHQRAMETYWSLRWLLQEGEREARATVLREGLVRFESLPLTARATGMPALAPGTRVRVELGAVDLIEASVACAYRETLDAGAGEPLGAASGQASA